MVDRSPNFPAVALGDAIENVRKVFQSEGRSSFPRLSAVKPLGYNSLNGRSLRILGALKAYDLLDGRGDELRVTDTALAILMAPEGSSEKSSALMRAFRSPQVFSTLMEHGEASAETLRWHLINAKFKPDAADKLVEIFQESKRLVNAISDGYVDTETQEGEPMQTETAPPPLVRQPPQVMREPLITVGTSQPDFVVKLGGGRVAIIEIKGGEATPRHLAKLERFIQLQRELMEDEDDEEEYDL